MDKRRSRGDKKRNGQKSSGKKLAIGVAIVLALGLIGFLVWYFVLRDTAGTIDYCEYPPYCVPSDFSSTRDVVLSESDQEKLVNYLQLQLAEASPSNITGFKKGPINVKETLKWMGENVALVDDQQVPFSVEELAGQQFFTPGSVFPPDFPLPEGTDSVIFSYVRVLSGNPGGNFTTTEPFKEQVCSQISCSDSGFYVPKNTFSSGKCPECSVVTGTACSSNDDCAQDELCLGGTCIKS